MIRQTLSRWCCALLCAASVTMAQDQPESFEVEGHKAYLRAPTTAAAGKPWIWYAPNVGGNFIILKHKMYTDAFLQAGIAIASYDLGEVRGAPGSTAKFSRFHAAMVQRGYSTKPILLGQSRGGLMTLAWACRNPDKVTAWAGIYPVCNLDSYPLRLSKKETLADFGMEEAQLRAKLDEFNPVSLLDGLAKQQVPMFSVHGDADKIVPLEENTQLLQQRYQALGGTFEFKLIPQGGHEVTPAFFECRELIDFILKHAQR